MLLDPRADKGRICTVDEFRGFPQVGLGMAKVEDLHGVWQKVRGEMPNPVRPISEHDDFSSLRPVRLAIHCLDYRPKGFSWTGEESILGAKCLADENGGLYIAAETREELIEALDKTLGCPMVTQRIAPRGNAPKSNSYLEIIRLASRAARQRSAH